MVDERNDVAGRVVGFVLRALVALLAGVLLARLFRKAFRTAPGRPGAGSRKGLDPKREVRAPWSEIDDEGRPRQP